MKYKWNAIGFVRDKRTIVNHDNHTNVNREREILYSLVETRNLAFVFVLYCHATLVIHNATYIAQDITLMKSSPRREIYMRELTKRTYKRSGSFECVNVTYLIVTVFFFFFSEISEQGCMIY